MTVQQSPQMKFRSCPVVRRCAHAQQRQAREQQQRKEQHRDIRAKSEVEAFVPFCTAASMCAASETHITWHFGLNWQQLHMVLQIRHTHTHSAGKSAHNNTRAIAQAPMKIAARFTIEDNSSPAPSWAAAITLRARMTL
eukprot:TRINITY_DN14612_c0_g1_i1.p1 TRINITY_DN14612_c0_g1~~TRINITY_DN14612_c0_g1_i1.p1  ORF type:complete len:139 (+),score=16.82 TRINITY_DN14612_c0_g1_i1:206-622(+)